VGFQATLTQSECSFFYNTPAHQQCPVLAAPLLSEGWGGDPCLCCTACIRPHPQQALSHLQAYTETYTRRCVWVYACGTHSTHLAEVCVGVCMRYPQHPPLPRTKHCNCHRLLVLHYPQFPSGRGGWWQTSSAGCDATHFTLTPPPYPQHPPGRGS
jgi:hypothetical protein